jgi:hypothetical protein
MTRKKKTEQELLDIPLSELVTVNGTPAPGPKVPDVIETDFEKMLEENSEADAAENAAPEDNPADDVQETKEEFEKRTAEEEEPEDKAAAAALQAESDDWVACEHLARIKQASDNADKAKSKMDDAKEKYKTAKETYDGLVDYLREIIREETTMPLFQPKPKPATAEAQAEKPADDGWQDIDLAEAMPEISAKVIEKLKEADIATVYQMSEFSKGARLTDIKGIGEATVVKIEEAMTRFWARRNEAAKPVDESIESTEKQKEAETSTEDDLDRGPFGLGELAQVGSREDGLDL